jgi:hypothetical protein
MPIHQDSVGVECNVSHRVRGQLPWLNDFLLVISFFCLTYHLYSRSLVVLREQDVRRFCPRAKFIVLSEVWCMIDISIFHRSFKKNTACIDKTQYYLFAGKRYFFAMFFLALGVGE